MENSRDWTVLGSLITVFISGVFGLIVAIVTWNLANKRENNKFKQDIALRDYKDREELYVSILAILDKIVKYTKYGVEYEILFNELAYISAKSAILATEVIDRKLHDISDLLADWTFEYQKGLLHKLGQSGVSASSDFTKKHRSKADELFPLIIKNVGELLSHIKLELAILKTSITKY